MKKLLLIFLCYSPIYSMDSVVIPTGFDYSAFDFKAPQEDTAANDFIIATQKIIRLQSRDQIRNEFLRKFEELFEKKCDELDIFQVQRLSFTSLLFINEWIIRGYVAQHCFEQSPLPKESREKRMKVVLRYPTLPSCQAYEKLGMVVGKDNNYLTVLHPTIKSITEYSC